MQDEQFQNAIVVADWGSKIYVDRPVFDVAPYYGYFRSVSALEEFVAEYNADHAKSGDVIEMPTWAWCTRPVHINQRSAKDIFADSFEELYDGAWDDVTLLSNPEAVDQLNQALDAFYAATQSICTYEPDYDRVLTLNRAAVRPTPQPHEQWRHNKKGSVYEILAIVREIDTTKTLNHHERKRYVVYAEPGHNVNPEGFYAKHEATGKLLWIVQVDSEYLASKSSPLLEPVEGVCYPRARPLPDFMAILSSDEGTCCYGFDRCD